MLKPLPRRSRLDAAGALHHIICRGIERRRIFERRPGPNRSMGCKISVICRGPAGRLRDPGGRSRRAAFGRAETAHQHRALPPAGAADPDPGLSDGLSGCLGGKPVEGYRQGAHGRQNHPGDQPPHVHPAGSRQGGDPRRGRPGSGQRRGGSSEAAAPIGSGSSGSGRSPGKGRVKSPHSAGLVAGLARNPPGIYLEMQRLKDDLPRLFTRSVACLTVTDNPPGSNRVVMV